MADVTASLDAATQQVLALLAQIRLSNVRFVQAQDVGAADSYQVAPMPAVASYGPDLVLVVDFANPNLTTSPRFTIQGLGSVAIQAVDGGAPAVGTVAGKRLVGFVSVAGGGYAARLLGTTLSDVAGATLISTAVIKTVGGPGADFADLNLAFGWLSAYRITRAGSVTFAHAAGKFTYTGAAQSVRFAHPDGARVSITCQNPGAIPPLNALANNGSGSIAADKATNLGVLRAAFPTELAFANGAQLDIAGAFGGLSSMLITGDGTAGVDGVTLRYGASNLSAVAVHGFGGRNIVHAVGSLGLSNVMSIGAGGDGLHIDGGGNCQFVGSVFCLQNGGAGAAGVSGGSFVSGAGVLTASSNALDGVLSDGGNVVVPPGSQAARNGGAGYHSTNKGRLLAPSTSANNNATFGYESDEDSYLGCKNTTGSGNLYGYYANSGSTNNTTGGNCTGTSTNYVPALNTVGNGNSLNIG